MLHRKASGQKQKVSPLNSTTLASVLAADLPNFIDFGLLAMFIYIHQLMDASGDDRVTWQRCQRHLGLVPRTTCKNVPPFSPASEGSGCYDSNE